MKLLIAYDGSPCADTALDDLPRAGLPSNVHAIVLSIADVWFPATPPPGKPTPPSVVGERMIAHRQKVYDLALQEVDAMRSLSQQAADRLRATFPGWQIDAEAEADSPAWAIIKKAEVWKPDLIVVGAHGHSTLGRLMLGTVSQKVVAEARCAVRIARARMTDNTAPVRLIIGMDNSPSAKAAIHTITKRVWPAGSAARVVSVLDPMLLATTAWETQQSEDGAVQILVLRMAEEMAAQLSSVGLQASAVVVEGYSKQVLLEESENWGADCIFVGARGLRGLDRFLLGSVSTAVAARAPCSVEIVHTAQPAMFSPRD